MKTFQLKTKLCFGDGALSALAELKGKRVFIVTDPFFAENGVADRVAALCKAETEIFSQVKPDPSVSLVARGLGELQRFGADTLIALGGGSAIDCAKGMVAVGEERPFFVAVPTTSGTGSEVTAFSVLTHEGVKHPLVEEDLRPDLAILDPALLRELPPSVIADAGMDVIAHCVEAVVAKGSSAFTQAFGAFAYGTVMRLLPRSFEGDPSVRSEIHCAATMAGIAFDHAGLGLCHSLSHALGGLLHLPHGKLNAMLLPHVMDYNRQVVSYGLLGNNPIFAVRRLSRRLGLPQTLREAGIKTEAVLGNMEKLCASALADPCTPTNPRTVTAEACRAILRACL